MESSEHLVLIRRPTIGALSIEVDHDDGVTCQQVYNELFIPAMLALGYSLASMQLMEIE
jgi:hypothetical protein